MDGIQSFGLRRRCAPFSTTMAMEDHPRIEISENHLPLAAEDRFVVLGIRTADGLCPGSKAAEAIGEALAVARFCGHDFTPVFDLRGLAHVYTDIVNFLAPIHHSQTRVEARLHVIGDLDVVTMLRNSALGWYCEEFIPASGGPIPQNILSLDFIDQGSGSYLKLAPDSQVALRKLEAEFGEVCGEVCGDDLEDFGAVDIERAAVLVDFVRRMHRHSLLVEFSIQARGNELILVPYHAGGSHSIETSGDLAVVAGRPAAIARATAASLSCEIEALQRLLNDPDTRERHLQKFLEEHPCFLRGLNYQNIYPQIVLERNRQGALRPDFILEPFDDAWCDILDLKLPGQKLIVGTQDRQTLAAAIHNVAAQLREYAAYFEDPQYRKLVKDRYGLQVYRPRLIALVGRYIDCTDNAQVRRAMTQYDDLQFMTFDDLVKHAKTRMLI